MNDHTVTSLLREILKVIGIAGTLLTVLLSIRSGYLYFTGKAQAKNQVESWIQVAKEHTAMPTEGYFDHLRSLDVAIHSIEQALAVRPNDLNLGRKAFMLHAEYANTDLEHRPFAYDDWHQRIPALTTQGWQLLDQNLSPAQRTEILVTLARLEAWMPGTNSSETVDKLLRDALKINPENPAARYRLALHLLTGNDGDENAFGLLQDLVDRFPDNPVYLVELGRLELKNNHQNRALSLLQRTLNVESHASTWDEEEAKRQARTLIYAELKSALRGDANLPPGIDSSLADELMDGYFSMTWSDKALAGSYWWRKGDYTKAVRYLVESDTQYDRQSIPRIVELELGIFEMPTDDIFPSLVDINTSLARGRDYDFVANLLTEVQGYISTVKEKQLFDIELTNGRYVFPGIEIQYWPETGTPLLARRVVPGSVLANVGLRPGDRLVSVNGQKVQTIDELQNVLIGTAHLNASKLVVIRRQELLTLPVIEKALNTDGRTQYTVSRRIDNGLGIIGCSRAPSTGSAL